MMAAGCQPPSGRLQAGRQAAAWQAGVGWHSAYPPSRSRNTSTCSMDRHLQALPLSTTHSGNHLQCHARQEGMQAQAQMGLTQSLGLLGSCAVVNGMPHCGVSIVRRAYCAAARQQADALAGQTRLADRAMEGTANTESAAGCESRSRMHYSLGPTRGGVQHP